MSLHRWLSIGALVVYLVAASIVLPEGYGEGKRDIVKAVGLGSRYFWLPLYLIWTTDNDSRSLYTPTIAIEPIKELKEVGHEPRPVIIS